MVRFALLSLSLVVAWGGFGLVMRDGLAGIQRQTDTAVAAQRIDSRMLQLRRHEKDFLQRSDLTYRAKFDAEFAVVLTELEALAQSGSTSPERVRKTARLLEDYAARFRDVVLAKERLGLTPKSGLQGDLSTAASDVRGALGATDPKTLAHLERAQAQIRKFLLARSEAHRADSIEALRPPGDMSPALAVLWARYQRTFEAFVAQMEALGLDEKSGFHGQMRRSVHAAEPEIDGITRQARAAARQEIERLSNRLLAGLLGTLVVTLFLCVLLFRNFNRVEKLRRSVEAKQQELEVTLESIGDGVLATDRSGHIRFMNGVASTLTGWSADEAKERPIDEVFAISSGITGERVPTPVKEVLETGKIVGLANHTVLESKDGTKLQIADSAAPIFEHDGTIIGTVLVFRDVTEQYRLEEQLRQSGKLESLGLLAGGVAHDFNNLLTAILSAAEVLKLDDHLDEMSRESVDVILMSSTRAADLTSKLLSFSRKGKVISSPIDIHPLLSRVADILKSSLSKDVQIILRLDAKESEIIGDPSQLEGIFMNLGINGADAMPRGGQLTFSTEVRQLDESFCEESSFDITPGDFIQISVEDEGEGIDLETQKRIFEPFFTTKPEGEGTGLGLASAYGAVRDHDGEIRVYSEPSHGTVFRLLLPLNPSRIHRPESIAPQDIPRGSGRILIVDDESYVRSTTRIILESVGYTAVAVESAEEALEELTSGDYQLALIDMVMPKKSGEELFYELRESHPKLAVVLMSGFTKEANVNAMRKAGLRAFVRKPFTRAELASTLSRALSDS